MLEIKPEIFTLSNGVRVVYLHSEAFVAHLGLTILAGSRFEQKNEEGLAHFLEHCIFKGTKKRKSIQVLSRLDAVGGELNAYTAKEEMCVYASFSKMYFNRASELLADIVLNSTFPDKELEKEKEIILDEINSYLDAPGDKIFDDFEAHLFPGHTLGNNILGTKESVSSFSSNELQAFISRHFTSSNTVISFVGDIPLKKLKNRLEKDFCGISNSQSKPNFVRFNSYKPFHIRSKEANVQTHGMIGGLAPSYNNEHRRAMTLLINVLGGPALNSRLILSVRERYGYAYNIEANYSPFADTGYWSIYFGTDKKYINKTLKVIYAELKKLREKAFTEKQLKQAKEQLKGHLALSLDSNSGLMLGLGKSLLLFNQIDSIEEINSGIDKLTLEDLREVAALYFDEDKISELIFE